MSSSSFHPVRRKYEPAPVCHGGGFVFPELNNGIPWRTPDEWAELLDENDVQCEWPECEALATTLMVVEQFTPFLCATHSRACEIIPAARRTLKDHFRDIVLVLSYGTPKSRGIVVPKELSVPYVPYDQRTHVQRAPTPRLQLPKLGQNRT